MDDVVIEYVNLLSKIDFVFTHYWCLGDSTTARNVLYYENTFIKFGEYALWNLYYYIIFKRFCKIDKYA